VVLGPGLPGPERLPRVRPRAPRRPEGPGGRRREAPTIAALANKAAATTGIAARQAVFEQYQEALNQNGPFIPLLQPAEVVVGTTGLKNLQANGLWLVDLRNLG